MTTVTVNVPATVATPRGAAWAAEAAAALSRAFSRWTAPRCHVSAPIIEAAQVRELAKQHLSSDPSFAADLFAAADRHESTSRAR